MPSMVSWRLRGGAQRVRYRYVHQPNWGKIPVKAPPFAYVRATSLDQVFDLKAQHGDDARILAGGQSLMAMLNLRLDAPELLIDINGLDALKGIDEDGDAVVIGGLTRHVELERSALVATHLPLIAEAMPNIAHPAIRNRGTIGGSIALADPAAELPACVVALDAEIKLVSGAGERTVKAREFFHGLYDTARNDDELVAAVRVPKSPVSRRYFFSEITPRRGDFASAGLAATVEIDGDTMSDLTLVFFGLAGRPILAARTGDAASGAALTGDIDQIIGQVHAVLDEELETQADLHSSAKMKSHLARVLTKRALTQFAAGRS